MSRRLLILIAIVLAILISIVYLAIAAILLGAPLGSALAPAPSRTLTPLASTTAAPQLGATATPTYAAASTPTPPVVATPAATPASAPLPTRTLPPLPTATSASPPTPVPPTPISPALYQLDGNMLAWPDCGWTGVYGVVRGADNLTLEGVQVRAWNGDFTWSSDIVASDAGGNYSIRLDDKPQAGRWFVQVLQNGPATWNMRGFETSSACQTGLQRFQMNWRRAK